MDCILLIGLMAEIAATAFILWLLPNKNWELFCETVDCFPENCRRLAAWYCRRIMRAWEKFRENVLQRHIAAIKK